MKYKVTAPILHNGKKYPVDSWIELNDSEFEQLSAFVADLTEPEFNANRLTMTLGANHNE